ncbi:MAG: cytochrome c [Planctomycetaceae bacterium]|nr:MAG: cytochrome c [Planctomycetaceae bacterium]
MSASSLPGLFGISNQQQSIRKIARTKLRCLCLFLGWMGILCSGGWSEDDLTQLLSRIPPLSPQQALDSFVIQHGFRLELVACEPDVVDPIDAAFDEDGRMYVVQMSDYPFLPEQREEKYRRQRAETWGSIRRLEDRDGDGRMEVSVVFADHLRWPQSVICAQGGVYVLSPPHLLFLKDTDGDGLADIREEVLSGFDLGNVQALANGLEWGLDGWIYFAGGRSGAVLKQGDRTLFQVNRSDIRFDPLTRRFELVTGGEQFGHTFDDWGQRFVCNNSNHLIQVVFPRHYLERNPQLSFSNVLRSIAREGAAAPVYRISPAEPWRVVRTARRAADPVFRQRASATELVATGFFTSATGVTVYRGAAYPPEFRGNVFIGDVGGNLVHRKRLTASDDSITLVGTRTEDESEFLASRDNWFRPVNFVNAPDGTLYILDMYRETIEHPASIPEDIKQYLDLESGHDRGRIYRLVAPQQTKWHPPSLGALSSPELVSWLASPHGWVRDTAQRLLLERRAYEATESIRTLVRQAELPQARLQALWTLQRLHALQPHDLFPLLEDPHPILREHAVRLCEGFANQPELVLPALLRRLDDPSLRVRWQLALTLGEFQDPRAIDALHQLARQTVKSDDLNVAILSSLGHQPVPFAERLLQDDLTRHKSLCRRVVQMIGSRPEMHEAGSLLVTLMRSDWPEATHDQVWLDLAEGLSLQGRTLDQVIQQTADPMLSAGWQQACRRWQQMALDSSLPLSRRLLAIKLLQRTPPAMSRHVLFKLLDPATPPELHTAAAFAVASYADDMSLQGLWRAWRGLGPEARRQTLDMLVRTRAGAEGVLAALRAGHVRPAELDRDRQQFLLNHPVTEIRQQARQVLEQATANRRQVVEQYRSALQLTGDIQRGHEVYRKLCSNCHRVGQEGYLVGPDLMSVQNKSVEDLLIAILDPNREAQPIYTAYTAATVDGRVFSGIIVAETANSITLRRAEAKEDVVLRDQLEELLSTGQSLMPEGLEKDLTPQQLADLLAWIKGLDHFTAR